MDRVDVRICGQDQDKTNFLGGTEVSLYKSTESKGGKTCHGSRGSKCAKQQAVIRILFAKSDGVGGGSGTDNGRKLQ